MGADGGSSMSNSTDHGERRMGCLEHKEAHEAEFKRLNKRLDLIEPAVLQTREKVFNGLSELPKRINTILVLVVTLIFGLIGGAGIWFYQFGRVSERLEQSIQFNRDWHEEVREEIDALEEALE